MPSYRAAAITPFKDDACQTDGFRTCTMVGTCNHYGLSIVNPAKGAAKKQRVIKRSPRGNLSARVPGKRLQRVSPRACGRTPISPFFKGGFAMPEPKKRAVKRTDAQRAAENKYKKAKQKKIQCNFFPPDYDLYEFARNREESMSSYLKRLIREDRERSENGSQ